MPLTEFLLIADDNPDDRLLIEQAWLTVTALSVYVVKDGEELMAFLYQQLQKNSLAQLPSLILLDLNMPRKDGFEVLKELQSHPVLCKINVIVLTTSTASVDVKQSYNLGARSYITKPDTFDELIGLMQTLYHYWFKTVRLPDYSSD